VDNRNTLAQKNAEIAKCLDQALAARNKIYEANRKHTREIYEMKQQIKSLEEEKTNLQEQLQSAQACKYLNCT
jgi:predicted nuclease with TOPRIM domain